MKKNFKFLMVAAAAIAMIGCAKDNGGNNGTTPEGPKGVKTYATVAVSQDGSVTRAEPTGEWNKADGNEAVLKTVNLYVFNANNQLEQVVSIDPVEGSKTFETVNGAHTLIVLANEPAAMALKTAALVTVKKVEEEGGTASLYSDFLTATELEFDNQAEFEAAVMNATTGFFMSNVDEKAIAVDFKVPTTDNQTPNDDIEIGIGRAFAKLNVSWDDVQPSAAGSGTISALEYLVLNNPVKMYGPQHFDNGVYKSYFHDADLDADNYYDWAATAWNLADETESAYIPENTNKQIVLEGERTAIGVKATFKPGTFYEAALDASKGYVDATWAANSHFFRIKDIRNATKSGTTYTGGEWVSGIYFKEKPTVEAAKKALGLDVLNDADPVEWHAPIATPDVYEGDYVVYEYEDASCYYYLGLERPKGTAPAKYNVARNDYFWVNINSISDCGEPTLGKAIPDDTTPVSVNVKIKAEIKLKPWNPVIQNGNL